MARCPSARPHYARKLKRSSVRAPLLLLVPSDSPWRPNARACNRGEAEARRRLARRRRQLARQALGMAARADLAEQAMRLAQLPLALLLLAALVGQLRELDVDLRLVRLRARLAHQLKRARERRLDPLTRSGARGAEQHPCQRQGRKRLKDNVPLCARGLDALHNQGARPLRIAEAEA